MHPNIAVKALPPVAGTRRKRRAPYLKRWSLSSYSAMSSAFGFITKGCTSKTIFVNVDRSIMPISRRDFLTTATVMYTSALYSSSVFSCDGGGLTYCPVPLAPSDFVSESTDESGIEIFLDKKYGRDAWSYSLLPISFRAPELSENSTQIPVEIRSDDPSLVGLYRSIEVFVHRIVKVWDTEKFRIPRHAPERFMISRVAEFKLSEQIVPYISMRLRNQDSIEIRMIAVFTPVDRSRRVEVVKQEKTIKIPRCYFDRNVYVAGKWPKGLTMVCMEPI